MLAQIHNGPQTSKHFNSRLDYALFVTVSMLWVIWAPNAGWVLRWSLFGKLGVFRRWALGLRKRSKDVCLKRLQVMGHYSLLIQHYWWLRYLAVVWCCWLYPHSVVSIYGLREPVTRKVRVEVKEVKIRDQVSFFHSLTCSRYHVHCFNLLQKLSAASKISFHFLTRSQSMPQGWLQRNVSFPRYNTDIAK